MEFGGGKGWLHLKWQTATAAAAAAAAAATAGATDRRCRTAGGVSASAVNLPCLTQVYGVQGKGSG